MAWYPGKWSVEAFVEHRAALPTQLFDQQVTVGHDHVFEAANISIPIDFACPQRAHMLLHVAACAIPIRFGAAQSGQEMEVTVVSRQRSKFVGVVKIVLVAAAEHQPE